MSHKILVVLDGLYRFNASATSLPDPDFTYVALVDALVSAGMDVTRAHREADSSADIESFNFATSVNLVEFDAIWLIGYKGRNSAPGGTSASGGFQLTEPELKELAKFMDSGGGVFATGDHDSVGADMCGLVPRIRAMRAWFGDGDSFAGIPSGLPRNYPRSTAARADTTRRNPAGNYSPPSPYGEHVWAENQSDSVPQPITPSTNPAHPILRNGDHDIMAFPDHMHEGKCLGEVPGYDYDQILAFDGASFSEFPQMAGSHPKPEIIATGNTTQYVSYYANTENLVEGQAATNAQSVGTLSIYDGRNVGVGRNVTGATFHHYVDINLSGTSTLTTPAQLARTGPDAEKGRGFNDNAPVFDDIKQAFVNITNWMARPHAAISLILERSTFGQDEATISSTFDAAIMITVDGLKPSQFPGGGITSLAAGSFNPAWAPVIATSDGDVTVIPTAVSSDDPGLHDRLQRFTFTYRVELGPNAFNFGPPSQNVTTTASLIPTSVFGALSDQAVLVLVKSANPFMLDLANGNDKHWLSSDLKVFPVVAGESVHGIMLPNNATRAQAYQFINALKDNITPAQFEALSGDQQQSALSPFPTTTVSGKNVYNFAIARVRRNGTMLAANDVRLFFRLFRSQTTAALTYTLSGGNPTGGYLQSSGAQPIALPGHAGGEWLSFPCFAENRNASPALQDDDSNVRTIGTDESEEFFGVLLDTNLNVDYLPSTPSGTGDQSLSELLVDAHQCLVAQVHFAGTPIPNGANPGTSDKLAQRNIAESAVANPGMAASRKAFHSFEIEATPHPITPESAADELMLQWSRDIPAGTHVSIYMPGWDVQEVIHLADQYYARHELTVGGDHLIEMPAGGVRYIPLPRSIYRRTGLIIAELPLGIKKGQHFDVSVRQISNRGRMARFPETKVEEISLADANRLLQTAAPRGARATADNDVPIGVFDLGENRTLVTDLSVFDAAGDFALLLQHPDPEAMAAARAEAFVWRETIGAFGLNIPVSTRDDMRLFHMRLFSIMSWRFAAMNRNSRWHKVMAYTLDLLSDKVQALGGNPFDVPATPDGHIPQLPWLGGHDGEDGNGSGGDGEGGSDSIFDPNNPFTRGCLVGLVLALFIILLIWMIR